MRSLYHLLHTIICLSRNVENPSPLTGTVQPRNSGVMFRYPLLTAGSHCLRLTGSLQEYLLSPSLFFTTTIIYYLCKNVNYKSVAFYIILW